MKLLLVLPIIVPLATAAACVLAWRSRRVQRWLAVTGAAALLGIAVALLAGVRQSGIQTVQIGNWPAPYGITLVADMFSALMVLVSAVIGLSVVVYSLPTIEMRREAFGYYALLHVLLMGVCGAFLTGDIFNLYVWFEVMLIASFVLLALGGERGQMEGAIKYVTLNLMASSLFLAAVGILYGLAGTLNMADLSRRLRAMDEPGPILAVATLFLIAFGIKAAVFPLFFWLPASYHTPPVAISAVFAGLLTKVGVYALIRVFTLLFTQDVAYTHTLILVLAGFTMVTGVLGAAAQNDFRRILSFHIISQIGYMILGLGLYTPLAMAGSVFYILHHIIVKTNLFLISGLAYRLQQSWDLKCLGGLYRSRPWLAFLFLVPAMSLAGIPPLSGFFAKLSLAQAGIRTEQYGIVAVSLVVGLLTLYSMTKIWNEAFWKPQPAAVTGEHEPAAGERAHALSLAPMVAPVAALAVITLYLGLGAQMLFDLANIAAEQLMDPDQYVRAVLGDTR